MAQKPVVDGMKRFGLLSGAILCCPYLGRVRCLVGLAWLASVKTPDQAFLFMLCWDMNWQCFVLRE